MRLSLYMLGNLKQEEPLRVSWCGTFKGTKIDNKCKESICVKPSRFEILKMTVGKYNFENKCNPCNITVVEKLNKKIISQCC